MRDKSGRPLMDVAEWLSNKPGAPHMIAGVKIALSDQLSAAWMGHYLAVYRPSSPSNVSANYTSAALVSLEDELCVPSPGQRFLGRDGRGGSLPIVDGSFSEPFHEEEWGADPPLPAMSDNPLW